MRWLRSRLDASDGIRIIFIIARREFVVRARSRFVIGGTALLTVALGGYIVLLPVVFNRTIPLQVGFVGPSLELGGPLVSTAAGTNLKIDVHEVGDVDSGEAAVRSGSLDVLVSGDPANPMVAGKDQLDPMLLAALLQAVKQTALDRAVVAAGADPSQVHLAVAGATIHPILLDPNAGRRVQGMVIGVVIASVLYVALVLYGQSVASGVVEEKANRTIEVLLSAVRPPQLLFGKVLGIGSVGFVQLLALGAVALFAMNEAHPMDLPHVGLGVVAAALWWFVLGFVFFALIYAAAGSMVSQDADLSSLSVPIATFVAGIYLVSFWAELNPGTVWSDWLPFIPPISAILMPELIATGDAQVWQVLVASAVMVLAIALLAQAAAKVYSNAVLRFGSRLRFTEAWKGQPFAS